jgi:CheY-like chemotaxis protein
MRYSLHIPSLEFCDHAYNGKQALEAVKLNVNKNGSTHCQYKLILMDCNMPFMDGYDATKYIREYLYDLNINQPIITAVTGHVDDNHVEKALEYGMNQVVSKPINVIILRDLLTRLGYLGK